MNEMMLKMGDTPEQSKALELHFEILAASRVVADSLLDLGRKLKLMRDTKGYRQLGYERFEEYTEAAVGIRQRQAYNYIGIVETLPAQLIEQNAAAGVTKLAILGQIGQAEQTEVIEEAGDLTTISVKELQALVDSKKDLGEQLSLLEEENKSLKATKKNSAEKGRAEAEEEYRRKLEQLEREAGERERKAAEKARRDAEAQTAKAVEQAKVEAAKEVERAKKETAEALARAREEAARAEREKGAAELEALKEELRKAKQTEGDPDTIKFGACFERMNGEVRRMKDIAAGMKQAGKTEQAEKLLKALRGALAAVADSVV